MTLHEGISLLPILNLLLIPVFKVIWRVGKRLDVLEWNQKRVCDHLKIPRITSSNGE